MIVSLVYPALKTVWMQVYNTTRLSECEVGLSALLVKHSTLEITYLVYMKNSHVYTHTWNTAIHTANSGGGQLLGTFKQRPPLNGSVKLQQLEILGLPHFLCSSIKCNYSFLQE